MRASRVMHVCRVLTSAVLATCLASTALAADRGSARQERRKVESSRRLRLKEEKAGTAKARLKFGSSYLSDPALDEIVKGFPNLEYLTASCHANVTDAGIARVCELKKLKTLLLGGNRITNAGLKSLSKVKHLERLSLWSTAIDDAGLPHLKTLHKLRRLSLGKTKVTAAGVQRLQLLLPKCKISWFPMPATAKPAVK